MNYELPRKVSIPSSPQSIEAYLIDHNEYAPHAESLNTVLSTEEQDRAGKYVFEKDRSRYTAVRGLLRIILGKYLDQNPRDVSFSYADHGKPYIADASGKDRLFFNVSHTRGYSIIAVSSEFRIGIDIEHIHRITDINPLVDSFFTPNEKAQWNRTDEHDKRRAFFKWWVQKEAVLKWSGEGISGGFSHFEVDIDPSQPGGCSGLTHEPAPELLVWDPFADYTAAICLSRISCVSPEYL